MSANGAAGLVIRAAGGVLWRSAVTGREIAIVHRPRYDDWSLPKGKLNSGEHPLLAACREVVEETGYRPRVGIRLPVQEYRLGPDRKLVDYWAMEAAAGDFEPNDEVDVLRWVRPADAATWLSYDRDRALLRTFLTAPVPDSTILLVRHAKAGDRSAWHGPDELRPLEDAGRTQAETLRAALRWYAPDRVASAPPVRCLQTVEPVAAEIGAGVEVEPAMSETDYAQDPDRTLRRLRELAGQHRRVVVCSQGKVIPHLIRDLAAADGLRLGKPTAKKASVWALSFVDDRLVAADYQPRFTAV